MRFGKENLFSLFLVMALFLGVIKLHVVTIAKATIEDYQLIQMENETKFPNQKWLQLKINQPKKEKLVLRYEGIEPLSDDIFDGLQGAFDDSQVALATVTKSSAEIIINSVPNSLVVEFTIQLLPKSFEYEISLWKDDQKLAEISNQDRENYPKVQKLMDIGELKEPRNIAAQPAISLPTSIKSVDVTTGEQFRLAVEDTSIDRINILNDIELTVFTPNFKLNRDLVIIGVGTEKPKISISKAVSTSIPLSSYHGVKQLFFTNLRFDGAATSSVNTGLITGGNRNWTVIFDDFVSEATNSQRLAVGDINVVISGEHQINTGEYEYLVADTVTFNNAKITSLSGLKRYIAKTRQLHFTNATEITGMVTHAIFETSFENTIIQIDGRSKLTIDNAFTGTSSNGAIFKVTDGLSQLNIYGDASLKTRGGNTQVNFSTMSRASGGNGGILNFDTGNRGPAVFFNVANYATVNFDSKNPDATAAVTIQAMGAEFNVDNHSYVRLENAGSSNSREAVIRFRYAGAAQFNITNHSQMFIKRRGKSSNAKAAAIRMNGGGNKINVQSGSTFCVINEGNGVASNPSVETGEGAYAQNQAIQFLNEWGSDVNHQKSDSFILEGENSSVQLYAHFGPVIDAAYDVQVIAGARTFFEAIGRTTGGAIFAANNGALDLQMTEPMYYDFRNNTSLGGELFKSAQSASFPTTVSAQAPWFSSLKSDSSFWSKGEILDNTPNFSRTLVSYDLRGASLNLYTSPDDNFTNRFGGVGTSVNQYSRVSANNAAPIVEGIRQGTDADKSVYVFASVPEGFDENGVRIIRPAWREEVQIAIEVAEPEKAAYQLQGTSESGPTVIYNDANQRGYVCFDFPNPLTAGTTIKVVNAWRGTANSPETLRHTTPQTILNQIPIMTIADVTPPKPARVSDNQISYAQKVFQGEQSEAGSTVYVGIKKKGDIQQVIQDTKSTVKADGTWRIEIPQLLEIGDEVSFYLEDQAGAVTNVSDIHLASNTGIGNRNPYHALSFHDATFPEVIKYTVEDTVPRGTIVKSFVNENKREIVPGDILTFTFDISNNEAEISGQLWSQVNLVDVLQQGLEFIESSVIIDGTAIDDNEYSYNQETKTLSIPLEEAKSGKKNQQISFQARVKPSAIGTTIKNKGTVRIVDSKGVAFSLLSNEIETQEVQDNTITVCFKNLNNQEIHKPIILSSSLGDSINLATNPEIKKAIATVENQNYQIQKRPDSELITISGKGETATYLFDGSLRIVETPSEIDFGSIELNSKIQRVNAPNLNNQSLSIKDTRSKNQGGWLLTAALTDKMTNLKNNSVIEDALRYVTGTGKEHTLSKDSVEVVSNHAGGNLVVTDNWGNTADTEGLKLVVHPAEMSFAHSGNYSATITWIVTAGPMGGLKDK